MDQVRSRNAHCRSAAFGSGWEAGLNCEVREVVGGRLGSGVLLGGVGGEGWVGWPINQASRHSAIYGLGGRCPSQGAPQQDHRRGAPRR
eukprot:7386298-Prymnesium_polylepis.3